MCRLNPLIMGLVGVLIAVSGLPGCSRPAQGWVQQIGEGGRAPDFEFTDEQGRHRRFHEVRGELTVMMFAKCRGTTHDPVSPVLHELLSDSMRYREFDIIGVAVHWAEDGCPAGGDCHTVERDRRVLSICDGRGAIRRLYGVGESESLVLLGTGGRILSATPTDSVQKLQERLADEIEQRDAERVAEDIQNG